VRFSTGIVRFSTDGIQRLIESNLEHKEKAEIVMALAQAQIQIQAKETEIQAKEAEMQAKEAEMQAKLAQEKERKLRSGSSQLMKSKGAGGPTGRPSLKHRATGSCGFACRNACLASSPPARWLTGGCCLVQNSLPSPCLPDRKVVALYQHLSGFIHKSVQQSGTVVDIVEGAVNVEQMGILVCMVVATKIPYKLQYSSAVVGSSLDDASGSSEGETSSEEGSRGSSESTRDAMQL